MDMDFLANFLHVFLHLDKYLNQLVADYGMWTYAVLFLVIFCETGLVVTPILPGDSLIFATGALASVGELNVWSLFFLLTIAAIVGDSVNYGIGHFIGPKVFHFEQSRFFKKEYLDRTHRFYEKHGGKTIIFARFIPIIRTFAPFIAGVGAMSYPKFIVYNVVGGVAWVASFLFAGAIFGNVPAVKHNFTLVIMGIIVVSLIPAAIEFFRGSLQEVKQDAKKV